MAESMQESCQFDKWSNWYDELEEEYYTQREELPLVLSTSNIAGYLNIFLSMAYELMGAKGFPFIKILQNTGRRWSKLVSTV